MKNKCTLLVDSNWLAISRVSVMLNNFTTDHTNIALNEAKEEFKDAFSKSIGIILNRFPVIDNIIMMADGGSWRKQLPIPKQLENITYKGNRSRNVEYSWDHIWSALTEILENCKNEGITVAQHNNIEGDDWAWYWSRRLNSEGINTIIWSSDCDLKQLIQVDDKTNAFTVWYNDKNGLWISEEMMEHDVDDIDFFMQPTYENAVLEVIKAKSKSGFNYINPDTIILDKIICGDAGDNIKSVARHMKNGRTYRFSESNWKGLKNKLNVVTINDFLNKKDDISKMISNHKNVKPYGTTVDEISEMIEYNIKLVWLNESVIPETAVLAMNNIEYKDFDVSYIKSNYKIVCGSKEQDDIMDIFNSI